MGQVVYNTVLVPFMINYKKAHEIETGEKLWGITITRDALYKEIENELHAHIIDITVPTTTIFRDNKPNAAICGFGKIRFEIVKKDGLKLTKAVIYGGDS